MNTKRAFLTFDVNADKGISLGQSTTVEDLLSASRVMDLSSMTSLKAISSVWSWNEAGGVGEGDTTSMLKPARVSCLTPSFISGSSRGEIITICDREGSIRRASRFMT